MAEASSRRCVAVVGPGANATTDAIADAEAVGRLIAERGWAVLCGGLAVGVMAAVARGTASAGGVSVGLLPGRDRRDAAPGLTVALPTSLAEGRNAVIVAAAEAVVCCGMSGGTASEVALALRTGKPVVLVRADRTTADFFAGLGAGSPFHVAPSAGDAIEWIARQLAPAAGASR